MTGYFITLEGGEGTGKTTLLRALAAALGARGREVLVTREPGGAPLAEAIRALLLSPASTGMTAACELLLYEAARAEHCAAQIVPALGRGAIVLCDRFTDATLAYQGYARGMAIDWIEALNRFAAAGCEPTLTLLLDMPVAAGQARLRQRLVDDPLLAAESRLDQEALDFHERVRAAYLHIAQENPDRVVVLNAEDSPETIAAKALQILRERLSL